MAVNDITCTGAYVPNLMTTWTLSCKVLRNVNFKYYGNPKWLPYWISMKLKWHKFTGMLIGTMCTKLKILRSRYFTKTEVALNQSGHQYLSRLMLTFSCNACFKDNIIMAIIIKILDLIQFQNLLKSLYGKNIVSLFHTVKKE